MRSAATHLSLAVLALAASVVLAQAQTPDPHHPAGPAPSPEAVEALRLSHSWQQDMPMPDGAAPGGQPGPMGADMGRMMGMMRPMMAGGMGMPFEHIEGRIAYLKAELQVTDAQSAPWTAFADNMRTDAAAMKTMQGEMMKGGMSTAVLDRMALIHKIMSSRLELMEHSGASIKALYAALSPEQRTTFDQMMSGPMGMM